MVAQSNVNVFIRSASVTR